MGCRVLKDNITRITQGYKALSHRAVDLGHHVTHEGILAHTAGTVKIVFTGHKNDKGAKGNDSYGNLVRIEHGNGYATLYAHLDSVCVKTGQKVEAGQQIGTMGNTGNSCGEHLHFEVRKNNIRINPIPYLDADLPGLPTKKWVKAQTTANLWLHKARPCTSKTHIALMKRTSTVQFLTGDEVKAGGYTWVPVKYGSTQGYAAKEYLRAV